MSASGKDVHVWILPVGLEAHSTLKLAHRSVYTTLPLARARTHSQPSPNTTGSPAARFGPLFSSSSQLGTHLSSGLTWTVCPVPGSQATLPVCWLVQWGSPCHHTLTCKSSSPLHFLAPQIHRPLWSDSTCHVDTHAH